jgi:acetolactate synthase small subunit
VLAYRLYMTRILLILSFLALNYFNCFAQTKNLEFDRMRISLNGDSLIKQEYELIVKTKKVYFITPFASYLHIKEEKYRTRVKLDKNKREKTFKLVDQLTWTNFPQMDGKEIKNKYFVVVIFS